MSADRPTPARKRVAYFVVAIGFAIFGSVAACISALTLVPEVRAALGYGTTGTFTLAEQLGCDRYPPPEQRCGWFGDFRGDDGKAVERHVELLGGLPADAQVGEKIAARDSGYPSGVYRADDHDTWQFSATLFAGFTAAALLGIVLLQPPVRRAMIEP